MRMGGSAACCALLGLLLLSVVKFEFSEAQCSAATNCSQCLDAGHTCKWCADETEPWRQRQRCQDSFSSPQCHNIVDLRSSMVVTKSEAFSDDIQVQPQVVRANLRPGESVVVTAKLHPSRNYPLDVYYLMDHSASMSNDLETMKNFSASIADAIRKITTGFRLGYGTYVDKPLMPIALANLDGPLIPAKNSLKPFAFKNALPLTSNGAEFVNVIADDVISGNLDNPEGTLDAMIQAAVCTSQIGWRETSRRVMLIATDHVPHYAGGGQILGITKPNDGQCHLDINNTYTDFYYDYPSSSFTNYIMRREKILPIFMVTQSPQLHYDELVKQMSSVGARRVELTADSSNIIDILGSELARLVKIGRIIALPHEGVNISVDAVCPDGEASKLDDVTGYQHCTNLAFGKTATFKITVTALKCSVLKKTNTVVLRVVGYGDIQVNVSALCQCPCEATPNANAAFCSTQGSSQCGICSCNDGYRNKVSTISKCDCDTRDTAPCKQNASSPVCNGRGDCVCQECSCHAAVGSKIVGAMYTGRHCECDNFNCPITNSGLLCGGSSQGDCVCGQCQCKPGFVKDDCSCPLSNSSCMYEGKVCNGAGKCVCGQCQCDASNSGDFCETCSSDLTICDRAASCFNCTAADGRCRTGCSGVLAGSNGTVPDSALAQGVTVYECSLPTFQLDAGECMTSSFSAYEDITTGTECTRPLAPFVPGACPQRQVVNTEKLTYGLAGGLAALGIFVLAIIKIIIFYKERREYKQFMKAVDGQGKDMGENPLYQGANKVYVNPEYGSNKESDLSGSVSRSGSVNPSSSTNPLWQG